MDLAARARRQHGVVSRAQALEHLSTGELRWRLESGRWRRVCPGVYQDHTGPLTWPARASAALLHAGPGAALALHAAAHLHGFLAKQPQVLVVAVPNHRQVRRVPGMRVVRQRRLRTTEKRHLCVTTAATTVLGLAAIPGTTRIEAVGWAADAVATGECTSDDLATALHERRRHPHRLALERALGAVTAGAQSVLEVEFVQSVLHAHGLPPMRMQVPDTVDGRGIRRDFESEEFGVVVEVDGRLGHEGAGVERDRVRDRRTARSGRMTLRAGWGDVHDAACELALDLHGALSARGHCGDVRPCGPRCRAARLHTG
ncbi:MAG: type IV toxin-antitoxin system AbiEi family antitoxin domain-containing protein [Phycicoccus sp.]